MDFYQFINSRDIREYLRKLNYQFSSIEAAWLVWQSRNHSLNEKHKAWQEIINTMPDCEIKERPKIKYYPSLHTFLNELMECENCCIESVKTAEPNTVYSYDYLFPDDLWGNSYSKLYTDFSDCLKHALDAHISIKRHDETENCYVRIRKIWLDGSGNYIEIKISQSEEIVRIIHYGTMEKKTRDIVLGLNGLWLNFPTPYKKGDIICDPEYQNESDLEHGPCVIEHEIPCGQGVDSWQESGDNSDMVVHGLFQRRNGTIYEECTDSYMNFEYYRRPLTGKRRILGAISNYLKGEITLELLLAAYNTILSEERTIETRPWNITKEGLDLAYIPENSG